jgi:ankyrin repeat protein
MIMELLPKLDDVEYENAAECVKILVDYGCSVNMPNDKSRTPFNLLLKAQPKLKNKHELVDYIMKESKVSVDLYTYREKEIVDLFKKNNPHHELPPRSDKQLDVNYMESLIRNRKEADFMADYQKFKEQTDKEKDENKSNNFKEILAQFLYRAVESDCENIVQLLIEDGADVNAKPSSITGVHSTMNLACLRGNFKILDILCKSSKDKMSAVSSEKKSNPLHIITEHFGMDPSRNAAHSYEKCFEVVIKHCDKKIINQQDENGTTPLHYAARYRNEEAVLELLKKGER